MSHERRPTRRAFLKATARKAAYVAPAALALQAARPAKADYTGCVGPGSPCADDPECCSNDCRELFGAGGDCATSMYMIGCQCT